MDLAAAMADCRRRVSMCVLRAAFRTRAGNGVGLSHRGIRTVLVCRRNIRTIGDALLLTPLLAELAAVLPGAAVDIVCGGGPAYGRFVAPFPNVNYVHPASAHVMGHLLATLRAFPAVRRRHYDLAIDQDPWSQTGRLLTLVANAEYSLGFVGPRKSGALTYGIAIPTAPRHRAKLPVFLLCSALGEDPAAREYPQPKVMLSPAEREHGRAALAQVVARDHRSEGGPRIGVFANATAERRIERYWWRAFVQALQVDVQDCHVVEIAPPPGQPLLGGCIPFFYSRDLREVAAVIASLNAHISADCGVMHLAWATGVPTVGLFRVTDPEAWGPFGPRTAAWKLAGATPTDIARRTAAHLQQVRVEGGSE